MRHQPDPVGVAELEEVHLREIAGPLALAKGVKLHPSAPLKPMGTGGADVRVEFHLIDSGEHGCGFE